MSMRIWGDTFGNPKKPIIGKNVTMSGDEPVFFDVQEQITIGDDSFFGHGVKLLTGGHDYTKFGEERQKALNPKPITIEEGAWIASFAIILGGVTIGKHSVIGAGSVVTHSIPPYVLAAGNPCRIIKKIPHD